MWAAYYGRPTMPFDIRDKCLFGIFICAIKQNKKRKEDEVMNVTTKRTGVEQPLTMTMEEFMNYVGAGRHTATKIVEQAEAKIYIGRRVLINVEKVKTYLDSISE